MKIYEINGFTIQHQFRCGKKEEEDDESTMAMTNEKIRTKESVRKVKERKRGQKKRENISSLTLAIHFNTYAT